MSEDPAPLILLREILVAIDTSKHSQAALEAAVALAQLMEANLRGVFVEDERWSRISHLPFSSTINDLTGDIRSLEDDILEEQANILKRRLQRRLRHISHENKIHHTWSTLRGKVEEKILEAAQEADLITVGLKGHSFSSEKRPGSTTRTIIQKADKPVLIIREGTYLGTEIAVLYDASQQGQKGLKLALELAQKNESSLFVLAVDNNPENREAQSKELKELLDDTSAEVRLQFLEHPTTGSILNIVNKQRAGLLIIPKNQPVLMHSLQTVLFHLNCPLLLIN